MRENTNQKNSKYGHFLRSVIVNRDGLSKINFATFCENNYRLKNRPKHHIKVSYSLNIDHVVGDSIPWSQSFSDPVLFYQPWKACSDFWISVQYYPIQTLSKLKEKECLEKAIHRCSAQPMFYKQWFTMIYKNSIPLQIISLKIRKEFPKLFLIISKGLPLNVCVKSITTILNFQHPIAYRGNKN